MNTGDGSDHPADAFDDLAGEAELRSAAGAAREERRGEEEEYARAAARQWVRHRDLADVAREFQHRGDTVTVQIGELGFSGVIVAVGRDYFQLGTPGGRVDIPLFISAASGPGRERTPVPLVVRVVERAREGGRRAEPGAQTFRARLLEYDADEIDAVVGSLLLREELRGQLTIGRDYVVVRDGTGGETYLPLAWIAWVRPWRE